MCKYYSRSTSLCGDNLYNIFLFGGLRAHWNGLIIESEFIANTRTVSRKLCDRDSIIDGVVYVCLYAHTSEEFFRQTRTLVVFKYYECMVSIRLVEKH